MNELFPGTLNQFNDLIAAGLAIIAKQKTVKIEIDYTPTVDTVVVRVK